MKLAHALAEHEQVCVREFRTRKGGDGSTRGGKYLVHRQVHVGHGRNVVVVERQGASSGRDGGQVGNKLIN